jgi:hypothetical protein
VQISVPARIVLVLGVAALLAGGPVVGAQAAPPPSTPSPAAPSPAAPSPAPTGTASRVPAQDRDGVLGSGWRSSDDLAWTLSGDATGLHVLTARASKGYAWTTAATLSEPGVDTDRWIGNACLTGSGRRLVVAYAPRAFDNSPALSERGAFLAVLDLKDASVRKLAVTGSLAYFSPSCGNGETAVVTQEGASAATRLLRVSARSARVESTTEVTGQVTSAVPVGAHVVAARGSSLVSVSRSGSVKRLASTGSTPYELAPDAGGGVVFAARSAQQVSVRRFHADRVTDLASGAPGAVQVVHGAAGRVFLTGGPAVQALPAAVSSLAVDAGSEVSAAGRLAYAATSTTDPRVSDPDEARPVDIRAHVVPTGRDVSFSVVPDAGSASQAKAARAASPARPVRTVRALGTGSGSEPTDGDRTCAVPRNDPKTQVYQPTARQVEWAADQAVLGNLKVSRPAGFKQDGLGSYTPQGLFPPRSLAGGGHVNVQVLLGVLAQESNLWQASNHVLSGEYGNPLVGNFYGRSVYANDTGTDWSIDWSDADCGYGVAQVTDGMRSGDTKWTATQQRAVAVDYAANLSAGLQILQDKWNQTYNAGVRVEGADPTRVESWFFAVWAYNTGFYPDKHDGSPWGVGWLNNPVNPRYKADRKPFLDTSYADAKNPQQWSYPEKVIGWAGHPIDTLDGAGYRAAWWITEDDRAQAQPAPTEFCTASISCYPGQLYTPNDPSVDNQPAGPCAHKNSAGKYDLLCYWHATSTWKPQCFSTCGNELIRFDSSYPEQPDGTHFPASCSTSGLPSGALVVDDVAGSTASPRCGKAMGSSGTFGVAFAKDASGHYPGKIDFHQVGGGYGGHFWFAHTRTSATESASALKVTGTWTLGKSLKQWSRVLVHLPDHGAHTRQATYTVSLGDGTTRKRTILQRTQQNGWVSLGAFSFAGTPKVSLSSTASDGTGDEDVAWDAVAFQPLSAKPKNVVVALGDSFSSGEGSSASSGKDFYTETDVDGDGGEWRDACHRSRLAWSRKAVLKDSTATIGSRADSFDAGLDFAFLACSGAETQQLLPTSGGVKNAFGLAAQGQFHELPQLDRGFLSADTTLVTLSIGGNDARFGDVMAHCILKNVLGLCQNTVLKGDTENLSVAEPKLISGKVRSSVLTTVQQIHKLAPNAKIVLMGYPELVAKDKQCVSLLDPSEASWIDSMSVYMNQQLAGVAADATTAGAPTTFADPVPAFAGKGACGSPAGINNLILLAHTPGDDPAVTQSAQSFHPNGVGTGLYAGVLNAALRKLGM